MKRNILLFFIAAFSCNICLADIFNIKLYTTCHNINDNAKLGKQERSLAPNLSATYDTDTYYLTVASPIMMYDAHIRITNGSGETVLDEYTDIPRTGVVLQTGVSLDGGTYTLEIECGDTNWYGYIE